MTEMVWSARFTYLHPSSVPESEGTAQSRDICCFFSSTGVIYVMLLSTHKKTNSKLNRIGVLYGQVQRGAERRTFKCDQPWHPDCTLLQQQSCRVVVLVGSKKTFFFCFSCSFAFVSWVWKGKLISCKTGKGSLSSTHKKSSLFRNHLPKIACKLCHFHIKALFIPNCFFWLHFWNRHFEGYCLNHYPKKICIL